MPCFILPAADLVLGTPVAWWLMRHPDPPMALKKRLNSTLWMSQLFTVDPTRRLPDTIAITNIPNIQEEAVNLYNRLRLNHFSQRFASIDRVEPNFTSTYTVKEFFDMRLRGLNLMLFFGVISPVVVLAMKKTGIPENLLTTNPITGSQIKIGGKTFNHLVNHGILHNDGTVKANSNVIIAEKNRLKRINNEHAEKRRMLIHGESNQRLEIILQDVETVDHAHLLLTQIKKYINLHFNNEVVALTEAVSSLNIKTTHH
ncbi:hypothetical protein KVV02_003872 [Mortierella alpina]|uniref:Uncharacterized protein n=1 Tax=Mortierella alpina TaxID=64518 RepID=A0A9P8CTZ7_MORAP|nr:hypothetical protein KVV02_003872 [Mortierella alpina]